MILPDKFTDPSNCVVYNSYVILKLLIEEERVSQKKLYDYLIKNISERASFLFVPTMDFLYLLEKVKYNETDDTVELIK